MISNKECKFTFVTANLRSQNDDDRENSFNNRSELLKAFFTERNFDIVAVQELSQDGLKRIEDCFEDYCAAVFPRDLSGEDEAPAIFFKVSKFELMGMEARALSDTDQVVGSRFLDQSICPRSYHLLRLRDKETRKQFFVINTHFDHEGEGARLEAAKQIIARIKDLEKRDNQEYIAYKRDSEIIPLIFCGDLNEDKDAAGVQYLENSKIIKDITPNLDFSYHGFKPEEEKENTRIDFIYITEGIEVEKSSAEIIESYKDRLISDHRFIAATFKI